MKKLILFSFILLTTNAYSALYGPNLEIVKDKYVVVFNEHPQVSLSSRQDVVNQVKKVINSLNKSESANNSNSRLNNYKHVYSSVLKGFSAHLSEKAVASLNKNPMVKYIVPDGVVSVNDYQTNPPSWGLDRIDQENLPLDNVYNYSRSGANVHAYIIDTGIRATHVEFTNRIGTGYDFVNNDADPDDCHGHGTHVAGTVGGSVYGVAKDVTIHAVKALNCTGFGTYSDIIAAIDWVTINHIKPAVINMSLGGGYYQPVNDAVTNAHNNGIVVVVAAGNSAADACNTSPASAPDAITVASSDINDSRSSFSNIGACVDIFAPGGLITSAHNTSDTDVTTMSGTSMASPHVAGVAALYLEADPAASPGSVVNLLVTNASTNKIFNVGSGSPNLLVNNNFVPGVPPPDLTWLIVINNYLLTSD